MDGANFPQPDCIHRARGLRPVAKFREYVPTVEKKVNNRSFKNHKLLTTSNNINNHCVIQPFFVSL